MSWVSELYSTYENNRENVGKSDGGAILAPVAHMIAKAQIEIMLDGDGNFISANEVMKENSKTIIPVTEASEGRSSGIEAHALCDTLSYVAGDYKKYVEKKEAEKSEKKFEAYKEGLRKWCESDYSHIKVNAVYSYIIKEQMADDLLKAGILKVEDSGKFGKNKISGKDYEKALVRFSVHIAGGDVKDKDELWNNFDVINKYTDYYISEMESEKSLCYITGEFENIAVSHPKGILASNYGAKLISANDKTGFVFRGRFIDVNEACTIGYESTQKIHRALTWLAAKQGVSVGSTDKRTFICWNPGGKEVPNVIDDIFGNEEYLDIDDDDDYYDDYSDTRPGLRKSLWLKLNNWKNNFEADDDIVIIGLDAATTGRLSVTYYKELKASDLWERLEKWGSTCCWYFTEFESESKKPVFKEMTPKNQDIVNYAFGVEIDKGGKRFVEAGDKIMKEHSQRILYCVIDDKPVPIDIVNALFERASRPLNYSYLNYERLLSTTCAVVRRFYIDHIPAAADSKNGKYNVELSKGGVYSMELDIECKERSYLFGRLLAILEQIEYRTYDQSNGRTTNAIRLQSAYVNHPMQTWQIICDSLTPYIQKLDKNNIYEAAKYKDMIGDILAKIDECGENKCGESGKFEYLNKKLEYSYLIGYYMQRRELRKKA